MTNLISLVWVYGLNFSFFLQSPITEPLGYGVRTYTTQLDLQDPSFTPTNVNDTNVPTQVLFTVLQSLQLPR